ncbi:hypothetical protein E4U19_007884 [Claviceps sp. Clav32 group G5]|nr:hypothetical protein E4U40_000377 [Claviceps sp. LM458 group G5]KAG6031787.1 hypothetical protein E4U19_007884 [Claviceps sp. Clav32 group G5]KAG6052162.1 hypothetical protein E4U39_003785 [Claviceps sp. Clav50 group G5]
MADLTKTIVATGLSSGIGFEALKQLLERKTPFKIIFGARDTTTTNQAIKKLDFDRAVHEIVVQPLDLCDLSEVKTFARKVLEEIGKDTIDYLLLSAGMFKPPTEEASWGSKWCEMAVVNHFSQHYLIHLLREKLFAFQARIVMVSSGGVRNVEDPAAIEQQITAGSGTEGFPVYASTKFLQLLSAHWWRRELEDQCRVIAVSPGMIPHTGLGRGTGYQVPADSPCAETMHQGGSRIVGALFRSDFPDDPERIFLHSKGDWWGTKEIAESLDKELQEKWCPKMEELEKDAGIAA